MLEKLFNTNLTPQQNEEQLDVQNEQRRQEEEERQKRLKIDALALSTFDLLKEFLEQQKLDRILPEKKEEKLTIDTAGVDFSKHNYKYVYFIVDNYDAPKALNVYYSGVRYTQTLTAGINRVEVPEGAQVKVEGTNLVVVAIYSNTEII